ncbi:hypothetical protein MIR68_000849 [Amoeboaphelidium protococcarum]|nr:hypothetical protein MIR68_000849 [Amoeboaphelidium protococcarum]
MERMKPQLYYHQLQENGSCGYCKNSDGKQNVGGFRVSYGAEFMNGVSSDLYLEMMNRNWRRSGTYFYRPFSVMPDSNQKACCPQLAIRLDCQRFNLDLHNQDAKVINIVKEHQRVIRKFVNNALYKSADIQQDRVESFGQQEVESPLISTLQNALSQYSESINFAKVVNIPVSIQNNKDKESEYNLHSDLPVRVYGMLKRESVGDCPSVVDIAEDLVKLMYNAMGSSTSKNNIKITTSKQGAILIRDPSYKVAESSRKTKPDKQPPTILVKKLRLTFGKATFKQDEYELWTKYQQKVHHDPPHRLKRQSYESFLCDSGLNDAEDNTIVIDVCFEQSTCGKYFKPNYKYVGENKSNQLHQLRGTFHLRYELADIDKDSTPELIAVSVVDILPTGLSSVYFFYDVLMKKYSLGVLSGLLEIFLLQQEAVIEAQFKYYYLGFYIHNCSKMNYKAQFQPCELLCPHTLQWVTFDDRVRKILDEECGAGMLGNSTRSDVLDPLERIDAGRFKYSQSSTGKYPLNAAFNAIPLSLIFNRSRFRISWELIVGKSDVEIMAKLRLTSDQVDQLQLWLSSVGLKVAQQIEYFIML